MAGQELGSGEELTTNKQGGSFWGDGTVLYLNYGGSYTSVCVCRNSKDYNRKRVNFTVHKCKTEFLGEGEACFSKSIYWSNCIQDTYGIPLNSTVKMPNKMSKQM